MNTVYKFDQADVIVSLDADFLTTGPGHTRYTREFSSRRDLAAGPISKLNRLYVVESMPTSTGRWPTIAADALERNGRFRAPVGGRRGRFVSQAPMRASKIPADWVGADRRAISPRIVARPW